MTPSAAQVLTMLPLAVFGTMAIAPPPAPVPAIVPVAVRAEGVTARRMDEATFHRRWPADLPPPTVIRAVPVPAAAKTAATIPRPPARIVKRASLRLDICAKHGMKRVEYLKRGYKHWRCRNERIR